MQDYFPNRNFCAFGRWFAAFGFDTGVSRTMRLSAGSFHPLADDARLRVANGAVDPPLVELHAHGLTKVGTKSE